MKVFVSTLAARIRTEAAFTTYENKADPRDHRGEVVALSPAHFPYVIVSSGLRYDFSGNTRFEDSLADKADALELPLRVTYAGMNADSVNVLQSGVRAALDRTHLHVPGWSPARIKVSPLLTVQDDTTLAFSGLHPWHAVDEYRVITSKER